MRLRWWLALIVTLAWAVPAYAGDLADCPEPSADADRDRKEAKARFERALILEPSSPAQALEMLRCADKLAPRAAISLRIGTIAERLGQLAEAADAFERYLALAGEHAPDAEPMGERIRKLRARVREQEAQQAREEQDRTGEGDARTSPDAQALAGWVAGGTGLAFAIVGVALLGAAKAHSDSVHDIEPGTTAWSSDEAQGTIDQASREQAVGIVGLGMGGALMVLGVILLATADGDADAATDVALTVAVGGNGASGGVRVRF